MNLLCRVLLRATLMNCLVAASAAAQMQQPPTQARPELDIAFTYTAQHSNTTAGHGFWMQGGSAQLSSTVYRGLGVVADVTTTRASRINGTGVNLTLVTTTFGPRYTFTLPAGGGSARSWEIFGEAMGGIANGLDSAFPSTTGVQTNGGGAALQIGGGADYSLTRHFAVRVAQAHWVRTYAPNAYSGAQNSVSVATGVVLRIP